jgi:hypothetical protein
LLNPSQPKSMAIEQYIEAGSVRCKDLRTSCLMEYQLQLLASGHRVTEQDASTVLYVLEAIRMVVEEDITPYTYTYVHILVPHCIVKHHRLVRVFFVPDSDASFIDVTIKLGIQISLQYDILFCPRANQSTVSKDTSLIEGYPKFPPRRCRREGISFISSVALAWIIASQIHRIFVLLQNK